MANTTGDEATDVAERTAGSLTPSNHSEESATQTSGRASAVVSPAARPRAVCAESPVTMQPPPEIHHRVLSQPGPVYVRIGTRMETAARVEQPWVRQTFVGAAPPDAPLDQEGIVIVL